MAPPCCAADGASSSVFHKARLGDGEARLYQSSGPASGPELSFLHQRSGILNGPRLISLAIPKAGVRASPTDDSFSLARAPGALDAVDRRLLGLLAEDGRRSYADLGQAVGLSAPSVYARVKKLEDRGVITQYTIATNPEQLGYGIAALVAVRQLPGFHWERLEAAFHELPAVEACHSVTGDDSYVLLVRVKDARSLEDLLREIGGVDGVSSTRTMLILSTTFERKRID